MRSRDVKPFFLYEIEEKGSRRNDLVVDFYRYLIKRRCRRHYTSATRLLERKIGRDERKMGWRRGSWFLILPKNGGEGGYDPRGDRWRGKGSWELIRDCQQILLTVAFRSGTSRRRWRARCRPIDNWSEERVRKEFVREQVRFMSEAKRLCFRWFFDEWRTAKRKERRRNGKLSH